MHGGLCWASGTIRNPKNISLISEPDAFTVWTVPLSRFSPINTGAVLRGERHGMPPSLLRDLPHRWTHKMDVLEPPLDEYIYKSLSKSRSNCKFET